MVSSIMTRLANSLIAELRKQKIRAKIVSVNHLGELQQEIENLLRKGFLDSQFYQERLTFLKFTVPRTLPKAESIIIVALPRPQTQAVFAWKGQRHALTYPPTYTAYEETTKHVENLVATIIGEEGYKSTRARLPLKLLAVRSGLAEYGKNNIAYVSGMGSFLELVAVFSDLHVGADSWQESKTMKTCEDCELCRMACPTGAIAPDRFLLRAECCIAYHNEKKGDLEFPNWMSPFWHNSIVGCMLCQRVCPENKEVVHWIGEKVDFSEKETSLILEGMPLEKMPDRTRRKMQHLSLTDYYDRLPRNLKALLTRSSYKKSNAR